MQSLARAKPLTKQIVLQVMSSDKSNSLCQVIELPVGRVIFQPKLANNGEVLAGVLFQGQGYESMMIPWEVGRKA